MRGTFGDPRTLFFGPHTLRTLLKGDGKFQFHFGVDVSAPNGTPAYPVASGVVTRVDGERIVVASANGRAFEYWHLHAAVRIGQRVTASATVLGRIAAPAGHVHLSELDQGVYVNPLQPGHLTPYGDRTKPTVDDVRVRRDGRTLTIDAAAHDMPSVHVPGVWRDLPITPAEISWSLRDAAGHTVVPTRTVYDVRRTLPAPGTFWLVYARGSHQNMTTFRKFYAYRQPGEYLFRLTPDGLDIARLHAGAYAIVVTATDERGNHSSATELIHVGR